MKCPHCTDGIHEQWLDVEGLPSGRRLRYTECPLCDKLIVQYGRVTYEVHAPRTRWTYLDPVAPARVALPEKLSEDIKADYLEAVATLPISPKASAALSRRSLQHLLRQYGDVKPSDLSNEIEEAIPGLPSYLADAIDGVRHIGNFAAHPIKSKSTGEIVDVEDGEAEWLLDTIEALVDFYIVQPVKLAERRHALNAKLSDAGKPEMRGSARPASPPVA